VPCDSCDEYPKSTPCETCDGHGHFVEQEWTTTYYKRSYSEPIHKVPPARNDANISYPYQWRDPDASSIPDEGSVPVRTNFIKYWWMPDDVREKAPNITDDVTTAEIPDAWAE